jgi:hypothetical protein
MQPRVFVGSSSESLYLAKKIQQQLHHCSTVQLWNQDVFRPGDFPLSKLIEIVTQYDFAIFLIAPDDIANIRGERILIARDNVVFEAGLFFSQLGRQRTILVVPARDQNLELELHLPSDLAGMSLVKYFPPASNDDLPAALGPACTTIEDVFRREGLKVATLLTNLSGGPIYLLRHLATRSFSFQEMVEVLIAFNHASRAGVDGWKKAAKYALQLLEILGLAELHGGDEHFATGAGKRLLNSQEVKARFPREIAAPLYIAQPAQATDQGIDSGVTNQEGNALSETTLRVLPQQLRDYLRRNGFKMVSFDRVRKNVNPNATNDMLQSIIDNHPDEFARRTLEGDKPGIGVAE